MEIFYSKNHDIKYRKMFHTNCKSLWKGNYVDHHVLRLEHWFHFLFQANNMGVGVVGIIECNFLKPTHNKQDFDYTNEYRYVTDLSYWLFIVFEILP